LGNSHFQHIFKELEGVTIAKAIQVAQPFPRFVEDEDNRALMEEVFEDELKVVLSSFKKDKSMGPDGWVVEFFSFVFDTISKYLLRVDNDSRRDGRVLPAFNSTFIALIPKVDNPNFLRILDPSLFVTVCIM